MLKNTAYAWRQALFFLSFADTAEQRRSVDELKTHVADQPQDWQQRFEPVVAGLDEILAGARFDKQGGVGAGRRYLGWSVGRHWLLPSDTLTR